MDERAKMGELKFTYSNVLPKTRSGKIMRRVLKAIAIQGDIGNVMTLVNPEVVQSLVDERAKLTAPWRFIFINHVKLFF